MKRLIRSVLNRVPRRYIQRVVPVVVPAMGLLYAGRGVQCPVCGARYRKFLPFGYDRVRDNALCPRCMSLERHRLMWLYLQRETDFFATRPRLLHIAPEQCFVKKFEQLLGDRYITADLESPWAKVKMDIQAMPLEDGGFDVVFCNHVLEHVDDDRQAMREIYRVMRPGGWGILLVPVNYDRSVTYEDPSITDEAGRKAAFGQHDHVREYGQDYPGRLAEAGFTVESVDYIQELTLEEVRRFALRAEILYVVRKPGQ